MPPIIRGGGVLSEQGWGVKYMMVFSVGSAEDAIFIDKGWGNEIQE